MQSVSASHRFSRETLALAVADLATVVLAVYQYTRWDVHAPWGLVGGVIAGLSLAGYMIALALGAADRGFVRGLGRLSMAAGGATAVILGPATPHMRVFGPLLVLCGIAIGYVIARD